MVAQLTAIQERPLVQFVMRPLNSHIAHPEPLLVVAPGAALGHRTLSHALCAGALRGFAPAGGRVVLPGVLNSPCCVTEPPFRAHTRCCHMINILCGLWYYLQASGALGRCGGIERTYRCHRNLDLFCDHRAACARSGILRSRGCSLEGAAATVCREAGARLVAHMRMPT